MTNLNLVSILVFGISLSGCARTTTKESVTQASISDSLVNTPCDLEGGEQHFSDQTLVCKTVNGNRVWVIQSTLQTSQKWDKVLADCSGKSPIKIVKKNNEHLVIANDPMTLIPSSPIFEGTTVKITWFRKGPKTGGISIFNLTAQRESLTNNIISSNATMVLTIPNPKDLNSKLIFNFVCKVHKDLVNEMK